MHVGKVFKAGLANKRTVLRVGSNRSDVFVYEVPDGARKNTVKCGYMLGENQSGKLPRQSRKTEPQRVWVSGFPATRMCHCQYLRPSMPQRLWWKAVR